MAEARVKRLIRAGELEAVLERSGRIPGAAAMRAFLKDEGEPGITRSRAERDFRKLLREAGLRQPRSNVPLFAFEADFLWEAEKVILEVDSWKFHGHRRAFERDRRKGLVLSAEGYVVIRVTWRQFTQESPAVVVLVARALERRRRDPG